jgi:ribosomal protein S18 acetylase RimI-like enzyme
MSAFVEDTALQVRILSAEDAVVYQAVRLRGLREHPEAFASSYEEEARLSPEQFAKRLTNPDAVTFGTFSDESLLGVVTLLCNTRSKTRHRAAIVAMYVVPEVRGRGIGKRLMQAAIEEASRHDEIVDLTLSYTVGNESARALYLSMGFKPYALEPRFLQIDGHFYDGEWMILPLREAKTHD